MLDAGSELTFSQARSTCVMEGGDLVATESNAIINYIVQLVNEADNSAAYVYNNLHEDDFIKILFSIAKPRDGIKEEQGVSGLPFQVFPHLSSTLDGR